MKRVTLDKLEPGMTLAQDIERGDGMLLAGAGTELSAGTINMIQRLVELPHILIEGASFKSEDEAEAWRQEELKKLAHRFSKTAGDPFLEKLKQLEAKRIMETE